MQRLYWWSSVKINKSQDAVIASWYKWCTCIAIHNFFFFHYPPVYSIMPERSSVKDELSVRSSVKRSGSCNGFTNCQAHFNYHCIWKEKHKLCFVFYLQFQVHAMLQYSFPLAVHLSHLGLDIFNKLICFCWMNISKLFDVLSVWYLLVYFKSLFEICSFFLCFL